MFIGATKPHTTLVAEHTFLLCKPDAEQHHRYILQTVSDAGFQVMAKSFLITPALAEEIAGTFQSVRKRMNAERGVDKLFNGGKTALQNEQNASQNKRRDVMETGRSSLPPTSFTSAFSGNAGGEYASSPNNTSRSGRSESVPKRHCSRDETHQGIIAEILRLTSRCADGGEGVNAGLPNVAPNNRAVDGRSVTEGDGRQDDNRMQQEQKPERRLATGAVLKNTMIEAMSYQDLLNEHVRHLAFGGTCLAVELSRHNAVEKLLEIVGPENPIDARRAAPHSLRARLGTDLIRNAVSAASNLAEASHCISAVFGFTTRYSAADIRAHTAMPEAGGVENNEQVSGLPAVVRPYCELVSAPYRAAGRGPVAPEAVFRIGKTNPQAHVSYYTGRPISDRANEKEEGDGTGRRGPPVDSHVWKQKAEQLEQQLAQERMDLTLHAKLLRARELDLLLREHALEKATNNLFAPARPFKATLEAQSLPHIPPLSSEEQLMRAHLAPPLMQRQQLSSRSKEDGTTSSQGLQEPQSPLPRHFRTEAFTPEVRGVLPVIEAEDISLLLTKPVRLRALYVALKHQCGSFQLTRKDVLALYDRSPSIQLLWMDDHREHFRHYLELHTEEPLSFDSFVSVLMFLLRQ
ncbi:nucleoside diphosphate kinase, putative [Trypanosoma cruzi marinkellei]|uniref:Nucleoside diphosphate kinase, putative n=1 Tax=Trypanosoma cruzi marinkellei TaxID=85056 RepID=K2LUN0_TRYCR|nr:nucleoside diphosphate kinase, putative [Trypanosoma cruzi marinkellei]